MIPPALILVPIAALGLGMTLLDLSGDRPTDLGVRDGRLKECPESHNCVLSQIPDRVHFVEPLKLMGPVTLAKEKLKRIIGELPRTQLIEESDTYLRYEFKSFLLGYVDDVEFLLDEATGAIHVRSASRLGSYDFGANRKRVENIRELWGQS